MSSRTVTVNSTGANTYQLNYDNMAKTKIASSEEIDRIERSMFVNKPDTSISDLFLERLCTELDRNEKLLLLLDELVIKMYGQSFISENYGNYITDDIERNDIHSKIIRIGDRFQNQNEALVTIVKALEEFI